MIGLTGFKAVPELIPQAAANSQLRVYTLAAILQFVWGTEHWTKGIYTSRSEHSYSNAIPQPKQVAESTYSGHSLFSVSVNSEEMPHPVDASQPRKSEDQRPH
jgi:hypothetical protein